jgi:L-serine dehydratase
MGPLKAAAQYRARTPGASAYRVTLYGSLAATGRGHMTDKAVEAGLAPAKAEIIWEPEKFLEFHPNAMKFEVTAGAPAEPWTVYSTGGGRITDGRDSGVKEIYSMKSMEEIMTWSRRTGRAFWEYVADTEGPEIFDHMRAVWETMQDSIKRGIEAEGVLPGGLCMRRKAAAFYVKSKSSSGSLKKKTLSFSYALAVAEENAAGGVVVTAPTCGSAGVVPAVLYRLKESLEVSEIKILRALMTAGLFGNIVKHNASISGAEVGCQGEVGTACAMAAAAATQLLGGTSRQIEYAAEMGIEHHLGLTCDPIGGLVQAPCIERNAFAAEKALNSATYSLLGDGSHIVSFDKVVKAMNQTGHDIPKIYKETSEGGLAVLDYEERERAK